MMGEKKEKEEEEEDMLREKSNNPNLKGGEIYIYIYTLEKKWKNMLFDKNIKKNIYIYINTKIYKIYKNIQIYIYI